MSRIAGETDAVVWLPPLAPEGGKRVSPIRTETSSRSMPSISAATTCTTVREPVPRSCVPTRISTVPSLLICASAWVPRPPLIHAAPAQPMPTLTGPGVAPGA